MWLERSERGETGKVEKNSLEVIQYEERESEYNVTSTMDTDFTTYNNSK